MRRRLLEVLAGCLILWGCLSPAPAQVPGYPGFSTFYYAQISTDTTTVLKSGPGTLHAITIGTPVATEVITVFDNTAASGTTITTITVPASPQPVTLIFDVSFGKGLTVLTATAASTFTVAYR